MGIFRWALWAFPLASAVVMASAYNASGPSLAHDYGRHLMGRLPQGSAVMTQGDNSFMSLLYFVLGRGERRDLAILHGGAMGSPWYPRMMGKIHRDLRLRPGMSHQEIILSHWRIRPLYSVQNSDPLPRGFRYVPHDMLYRILGPGQEDPWKGPWTWPHDLRIRGRAQDLDPREMSILALQRMWYLQAAEEAARRQEGEQVARAVWIGLRWPPELGLSYDRWVLARLHGLASDQALAGGRRERARQHRIEAERLEAPGRGLNRQGF